MSAIKLIVSCEHGGNMIPPAYLHLFEGQESVLASHRGWDPGTEETATFLAQAFDCPLYTQTVSRLLIEMNRSIGHPELFSEFTSKLSKHKKNDLIQTYYLPYRNQVEEQIAAYISEGFEVLHLSIHSFTPVLHGHVRFVDIGILTDDSHLNEWIFGVLLKQALKKELPEYLIQLNQPYNGADDGFTTYLRKRFDPRSYMGIELEFNQRFVQQEEMLNVRSKLVTSIQSLISSVTPSM
jgi:predicted N-formylglutamate amidohydrolase